MLDKTLGADWPDIGILSLDAYTRTLNDFLFDAPNLKNYTTVCIALVASFSRGNVTIISSDTSIHPVVNPNWLTDSRDQEVAITEFKRARAVFESNTVKQILVGPEVYPRANIDTDQ